MATSEEASTTLASGPPLLADSEPRPTPITTDRTNVSSVSDRVTGSRFESIEATLSPLNTDLPRSPCRAPLSHRQYCSGSGSLRPSCSVTWARCSGVAPVPRITPATSPGVSQERTKLMIDTRKRRGIDQARRRTTTHTMRTSPPSSQEP
jgi:hypothetical protein